MTVALPESPLVAEMRRDGRVSADEVRRAAAAYLANPRGGPFRLENGHALDVAAAVEGHRLTAAALAEPRTPPVQRQLLVLNALSLARTMPLRDTDAACHPIYQGLAKAPLTGQRDSGD